MVAFAKRLFEGLPKNVAESKKNTTNEPFFQLDFLNRLEKEAAVFLASNYEEDENFLILFAFLFSCSRKGHLCVEIDKSIKPELSSIWRIDDEVLFEKIKQDILSAFNLLKKKTEAPFIKILSNLLYLEKNKRYEDEIETYFNICESFKPTLKLKQIDALKGLNSQQLQAINLAFENSLTFISGGPGTGKTHTAGFLIKEFLKKYPNSYVALCAPTGKAVANLEASLKRNINVGSSFVDSLTLHKLFHKKIHSYLSYDLIIVDESSMIDVGFMIKLLKYTKKGSRLVFLGDANQLPPIGSGFIFSDLKKLSHSKVELKACHRTEVQEIVNSADFIKKGLFCSFWDQLKEMGNFYELHDQAFLYSHLLKKVPREPQAVGLLEKLNAFNKSKILCSVKNGNFGIDALNEGLLNLLGSQIVPIMVSSNDYSLDLYNGDQGLLINSKEAIFYSRSESESYYDPHEKVRRIPAALLPSYELSYAISIHKSQGSEYKHVSIVIPQSSEIFSRELLYTAITRSKKSFEIFSSKNTLVQLLNTNSHRLSRFNFLEAHEQG